VALPSINSPQYLDQSVGFFYTGEPKSTLLPLHRFNNPISFNHLSMSGANFAGDFMNSRKPFGTDYANP
jgi:hypothetical protein